MYPINRICCMIKANVSHVADIVFEIMAKKGNILLFYIVFISASINGSCNSVTRYPILMGFCIQNVAFLGLPESAVKLKNWKSLTCNSFPVIASHIGDSTVTNCVNMILMSNESLKSVLLNLNCVIQETSLFCPLSYQKVATYRHIVRISCTNIKRITRKNILSILKHWVFASKPHFRFGRINKISASYRDMAHKLFTYFYGIYIMTFVMVCACVWDS